MTGERPVQKTWAVAPETFALILIGMAGLALRLWDLAARSMWWDEAVTLLYTCLPFNPLHWFDTGYNAEAPLLTVLVWIMRWVVDLLPPTNVFSDFLLRLLPLTFSFFSIFVLFAVARRVTGNSAAALCTAALLAVSPFHVHYAQELRIYSIHVFCGLAAVYCLWRALEEDRTRWWVGMCAANVLLIYGHYISIWLIFCFNVYYLTQLPTKWRLLPKWTAWNALMLLLAAPAIYHAWHCNQMLLTIQHSWYPHPTLRSLGITLKNLLYGYGPSAWAYWPLLGMSLLLAVWGCWSLRKRWSALALLMLLFAGPILLNFFMWRARSFSMYEDRIFIFSGAMFFILMGVGLAHVKPVFLRVALLCAVIACMLPGLREYYTGQLHPVREHRLAICDKVDFRSAAAYLEDAWEPGDLLAHDSNFTTVPMRWYFSGRQEHLGASPKDELIYIQSMGYPELLRRLGMLPVPAETAVKGADRVWYMEAFGITADDQPQSENIGAWLAQRYHEVEAHTFDGVRLILFEGRK